MPTPKFFHPTISSAFDFRDHTTLPARCVPCHPNWARQGHSHLCRRHPRTGGAPSAPARHSFSISMLCLLSSLASCVFTLFLLPKDCCLPPPYGGSRLPSTALIDCSGHCLDTCTSFYSVLSLCCPAKFAKVPFFSPRFPPLAGTVLAVTCCPLPPFHINLFVPEAVNLEDMSDSGGGRAKGLSPDSPPFRQRGRHAALHRPFQIYSLRTSKCTWQETLLPRRARRSCLISR